MKKVEKVSIAEISFTLDSDAYLSLKQYLDSLYSYYENDPDGREIIADIEARIAELILEEQVYTKVVSRALIDTIIAQLGTPDQIDGEAGEGSGTIPPGASYESSIPRRLHRSNDGRIFGGVCSGFATFLDINVAWVRLVFLVPLILDIVSSPFHRGWFGGFIDGLSGVLFVTYIVLWIALPMARTPRQKLEARGERITPSSIRQNLQGAVNTPGGRKAASVAAELLTVLGRVMLFFVKFVMAVIGFSVLFIAVILFMIMISSLITPDAMRIFNDIRLVTLFDGMSMMSPGLFIALGLLCALLPLTVIGMVLLSFTFGWRLGRTFYGVMLGCWAVAMIAFGVVSTSNARFFNDEIPTRIERWRDRWDIDDYHHRGVEIEIHRTPGNNDEASAATDDSTTMEFGTESIPTDMITTPVD